MKTTMGTNKMKVWISENVGIKFASRLSRGLALGAVLVVAASLYFSFNLGEAGSPLASEQGACYPLYPELGPCASEFIAVAPSMVDPRDLSLLDDFLVDWPMFASAPVESEFVAVTPTSADRNDRGLFDEVLPEDLKPVKASSPFVREQSQCYPEDVVLGWCYGFAATPDPALATDATISGVQFEEWPEVGLDSHAYHRFMVEQGKVGKALSGAADTEVFAPGDDLSHILSSIDLNEVWPEIDSGTPIRHLMKQLEAGSPSRAVDYSLVDWEYTSLDLAERQAFSSSREENQCYPELGDQCSPGFNVGALYVAISPEILADLARMYAGLDEMVPGGPATSEEMAVAAEIDDGEAMVIYGYPASIFYALNEGKVARPPSINGITCYPEDGC